MWPLIIYEIGQYAVEAFDRKVNRQEVGCSGHIRKVRNHVSIRTDGVLEEMEESNALKCEKYIYIYIYIQIYTIYIYKKYNIYNTIHIYILYRFDTGSEGTRIPRAILRNRSRNTRFDWQIHFFREIGL